jgi:hypothetical protein
MPALSSLAQPWLLLNQLTGGNIDNAGRYELTSGNGYQTYQDMLPTLRQYDPNARIATEQMSNEGGATQDRQYLYVDPHLLPQIASPDGPGAELGSGLQGVRQNADGTMDTGDLFNPNLVKHNDFWGYYTPMQNSKDRMIDDKAGPIALAIAGALLGGFGGLSALQSSAMGIPGAARSLADGNVGGLLGSLVGFGGAAAGLNPLATFGLRTLTQLGTSRMGR